MTSKRPGRVGTKPAAAGSLAYVLSQTEGPDGLLRWHVIFRSGASTTIDGKPLDPKRPDYEAGGLAGALELLEGVAEDRQRFAESLPGDRHVLFLAVSSGEAAELLGSNPPRPVADDALRVPSAQ